MDLKNKLLVQSIFDTDIKTLLRKYSASEYKTHAGSI